MLGFNPATHSNMSMKQNKTPNTKACLTSGNTFLLFIIFDLLFDDGGEQTWQFVFQHFQFHFEKNKKLLLWWLSNITWCFTAT